MAAETRRKARQAWAGQGSWGGKAGPVLVAVHLECGPSHEPGGSSAGQGEETWVLVMTNVISGKSVNLSAHQCFHLCKGALDLMIPNLPSSYEINLIFRCSVNASVSVK